MGRGLMGGNESVNHAFTLSYLLRQNLRGHRESLFNWETDPNEEKGRERKWLEWRRAL